MAATDAITSANLSNDAIRTQVVRMYADFVAEVDPKGAITDYLLQEEILTFERKDKIVNETTKQERCRKLLDELFNSSNPRAFVVLREALVKDGKSWIVERIDEVPSYMAGTATSSLQTSKTAPVSTTVVHREPADNENQAGTLSSSSEAFVDQRLVEFEETNKRLHSELSDAKAKTESLEKELQSTKAKEEQRQAEIGELRKQLHMRETLTSQNQVIKRKVVIVGSTATGKTCLLSVIRYGKFPESSDATLGAAMYEHFVISDEIYNRQVDMALWDTSGQDVYARMRREVYPDTDVVLLCYSVNMKVTLEDIKNIFYPEVRKCSRKVPVVLVGNKIDLRNSDSNQNQSDELVSVDDGQIVANEIGAKAFVECSAKTTEGVREMLQTAIQLTLTAPGDKTPSAQWTLNVCKQQ